MEFYNSYAYENVGQELRIYLPGGDGWFQYTLRHIAKPFTDGGTYQNQDLWRLHNLYLCRKTSDGFERIYDFPLTTAGEWECAVKIEGTPHYLTGSEKIVVVEQSIPEGSMVPKGTVVTVTFRYVGVED